MKTGIGAALLLALFGIVSLVRAGAAPEPPSIFSPEILSGPPIERPVLGGSALTPRESR